MCTLNKAMAIKMTIIRSVIKGAYGIWCITTEMMISTMDMINNAGNNHIQFWHIPFLFSFVHTHR